MLTLLSNFPSPRILSNFFSQNPARKPKFSQSQTPKGHSDKSDIKSKHPFPKDWSYGDFFFKVNPHDPGNPRWTMIRRVWQTSFIVGVATVTIQALFGPTASDTIVSNHGQEFSPGMNKSSLDSWFEEQHQKVEGCESSPEQLKKVLSSIISKEFIRLLISESHTNLIDYYNDLRNKINSTNQKSKLHPMMQQYLNHLVESHKEANTSLPEIMDVGHLYSYFSKQIVLNDSPNSALFMHSGFINTSEQQIELYPPLFYECSPKERSWYLAQPLARIESPSVSTRDINIIVVMALSEMAYLLTRFLLKGRDPPVSFFNRMFGFYLSGRVIQSSCTVLQDLSASRILFQSGIPSIEHPDILESFFHKATLYQQSALKDDFIKPVLPELDDTWFNTFLHGCPPIEFRKQKIRDHYM